MQTLLLTSEDLTFDFAAAKRAADALAESLLGEHVCMSWYDKARDQESPAHVSECHEENCEIPGYVEYAENRGAEIKVEVGDGDFIFCYRSLGEFADHD